MAKVDYLLANRRGLLSAFASSLDDLPDAYGLEMIDLDKSSQPNKGRVIGYDRGHCTHHAESGAYQCHCHRENEPVSFPIDCRLMSVLKQFCSESLDYWLTEGFEWTESLSNLLDHEELIARMAENDNE